jgi:hypothetical protein
MYIYFDPSRSFTSANIGAFQVSNDDHAPTASWCPLVKDERVYLRYEPQKDPMCKGGAIMKCRSVVSRKSHRPKSRLQDQNEKSPHPDCVVADFPRVPAQRLPRYGQASAFEAKPSVTEYA